MIKLIAALILTLTSVATVVYIAPPSLWHGGEHIGVQVRTFAAPEIDPASAAGALTLLAGGVLVLRRRVAAKQ